MPIGLFVTNAGIAFAIIGGNLILAEKYPDVKWTKPFIATGQLALTLYVVYLVIRMGLSKVHLRSWELYALFTLQTEGAVIFCICAVIFSHLWLKAIRARTTRMGHASNHGIA